MLSTSLILRGQARAQEYRIRVDYDLSRSEDNRPRANPRPARDKLKRASVEPVSGTDKGLSVVGQGIWSMTTIFILLLLLLLILFLVFRLAYLAYCLPWRSRYMQSQLPRWYKGRYFLVFS